MKRNLFSTIKSIITNPNFNAPIDFFGDLQGVKMTPMSDELHKYGSCFEAFRCTYDYSFIESYSSRAGKEWETIGTCAEDIEDRYLRFATLSCGVNNAIDAGKKNPKKGEMKFEKFTQPISVRSDLAKRSGKLKKDGSFNPLLIEATQEVCNTNPKSAMGRLARVLDESVPSEFGLTVDKGNRPEKVNDTLVDAKDAVKAKDLDFAKICYDEPSAHYVVDYANYKQFVAVQSTSKNEHIARAAKLLVEELDKMDDVHRALGVSTRRVIRDAVKLYNAASKDLGNGREYAFKFMLLALHMATCDSEERIMIELVNESVNYLRSAADNWLKWYGNEYHTVTNLLFNINDLISLFNGEWVKAYNANTTEVEMTEQEWERFCEMSSNEEEEEEEDIELITDEEFLKLF